MAQVPGEPLQVLICDEFIVALDSFPAEKKKQAWDKIRLLAMNPHHNSLQSHRVHGAEGMWECYVNDGYRIIYDIKGRALMLWKIGAHSLIDHAHRLTFAADTNFRGLEQQSQGEAGQLDFQVPEKWLNAPEAEQSE